MMTFHLLNNLTFYEYVIMSRKVLGMGMYLGSLKGLKCLLYLTVTIRDLTTCIIIMDRRA